MKKKKKKKKKMPKGMAAVTSEHRLFNLDLRSPPTPSTIVTISTKTLAEKILAHANGGKKKLLRSMRLSRAALEKLVDASVQHHIANDKAAAWDAARAHVGTSTSSTTVLPAAALGARWRATHAARDQGVHRIARKLRASGTLDHTGADALGLGGTRPRRTVLCGSGSGANRRPVPTIPVRARGPQ